MSKDEFEEKITIDMSAIFSIKLLKKLGILTDWIDMRAAYFDMTGQDITENQIKNSFKKIDVDSLNSAKIEKYVSDYEKLKDMKIDYDPNKQLKIPGGTLVNFMLDNGSKTIQMALGITDMEKNDIFQISDDEDGITQKNKLIQKLNEPNFLLQYLNLDPDMFYIEKIVPGAWTTPMKIKVNEKQEIPIIVTNDKLEVTIKQKLHIDKDYMDIARKVANELLENSRDIKYPKTTSSRIQNKGKDDVVTVNIGDLHAGGLTHWTETSYDNWDSKRASHVLFQITQHLIEKQKKDWKARTLCIVYNGDILDIDNLFNKTSSFSDHTMQTDSRWNKIFSSIVSNLMYTQIMMAPYFEDIYLKYNRGNHDKQTMDALFLTIATSILVSDKLKNIHTDYDDTALLKESIFTWGKHLFISDHGESENKVLLDNVSSKYQDLMRLYPYVNITANHKHEFSISTFGDTLIFREPSLCPPTSFEADKTRLNGKANIAQTFKVWGKEERFPKQIDILNFDRVSLWEHKEIDPPKVIPSSMQDFQEALFVGGIMKPTYKQVDLARFYKKMLIAAKEGFKKNGVDISKMSDSEIINMARVIGIEEPIELRTQNSQFVIDNMDYILGEKPKARVKIPKKELS